MKKRKDFRTQKEFFQYLVRNKVGIIDQKKSVRKFSEPFAGAEAQAPVIKTLNTNHKDDVASGIIKRTIILNTYMWMDSHDDVHIDGVFSESIKERQDKIWHLHDHEYKITSMVGKPTSIYEKSVAWKDLGIDMEGNTMVLMMDTNIMKEYNSRIFGMYLDKEIDQHSVGMIYRDIELAINDTEEKEEFATWSKYINLIGNKDKAMEQGYFWAVKQATLIEGSCVLEGSNELTPTIDNEDKFIEAELPAPKKSFYELLTRQLAK